MTGKLRIDAEREIDGEIVILDLAEQRYIGGNRTVTLLWPLLERGTDGDEMAAELEAGFDVSREQVEADVRALVEQLRDFGLLVERE